MHPEVGGVHVNCATFLSCFLYNCSSQFLTQFLNCRDLDSVTWPKPSVPPSLSFSLWFVPLFAGGCSPARHLWLLGQDPGLFGPCFHPSGLLPGWDCEGGRSTAAEPGRLRYTVHYPHEESAAAFHCRTYNCCVYMSCGKVSVPSVPDFVSQLWRNLEGKLGEISH